MAKGYPTVREFRQQSGMSAEMMAAAIGITPEELSRRSGRPLTRAWAQRLGVQRVEDRLNGDTQPSPTASDDGDPHGSGGEPNPLGDAPPPEHPLRDSTVSPTPPPGARQQPLPADQASTAAERIAQAYAFIGGGVGQATGEPQVGVVFDEYSPAIGRAWVKAADENEFARRVVNMMAVGGPMGELVMSHVILLGGVLYVTGRAPALQGVYGRRFGPPPVVEPTRSGEPGDGGGDGADVQQPGYWPPAPPADDHMGSPASPPGA